MTFKFGKISERNLTGSETNNGKKVFVREDLQQLCRAVLAQTPRDFMIVDGVRTLAEQKIHVKKGNSLTMKSKHLVGKAIDFAPVQKAGIPDWVDLKGFKTIGALFQKEATKRKMNITWGGTWKWKDWGHIQLNV